MTSLFRITPLSRFLECPKQDWLAGMKCATLGSGSWHYPNKPSHPLLSDQSEISTHAPLFQPLANQPAGVCYLVWAEGALDWGSGHPMCEIPVCP